VDEDKEDFKAPVWDEEQLNLVRINMGHLYQQKVDDNNNGNGEESKANENKDEDDDAVTNYETTHNQVRDGDGDNTDDPGRV
jgi:malate synthase